MNKTPELFNQRNKKKKEIEFSVNKRKSGDVWEFWWYREGVNIWNEISKYGFYKRVCLILKNNLGNDLLIVAPITTKYHGWMEQYYVEVANYEKYWLKQCWIIVNQIKLIDKKRLFSKTADNINSHISLANYVSKRYTKLFFT